MKNVLLLENKYHKKYRNLGLMKFSTYFKRQGYNIEFFKGIDKKNTLKTNYDYIIYSTVFTFHFDDDIKTINYYKKKYPNANFMVGGISATLMADKFYELTGIQPHKGIYDLVENLTPDYDLFSEHEMYNVSEVFTARGCKNKCGFCAVKTLEPSYCINSKWKDSIDLSKPNVMLHDNNFTTGGFEHFKEVTDYLSKYKLKTTFDNGFDCRYFTEDHLNQLKKVNIDNCGLRFAFDNMNQDGYIQKVIKQCLDAGIKKSKIMVYVLFGFKDNFEEAMYRAEEIKKLGVRPYPQQYRPLDDTNIKVTYVPSNTNWKNNRHLLDFRFYWLMPGIYTKIGWDEYLKGGGYHYLKNKKNTYS